MALVVTAGNLIAFMLSWEIMSLSSFFLVVYDYEARENRRAGYLYFVFSQVGAMFILAAFGLIYAHTGKFRVCGCRGTARNGQDHRFCVGFYRLWLQGRCLSPFTSGCPMRTRPPPAIFQR